MLKAGVEAFGKEVEFARQQASLLANSGDAEKADKDQLGKSTAQERLRSLVEALDAELRELNAELEQALSQCLDTQKYFSTSEKAQVNMPPCELFFGHIANFLDALGAAWHEIERNPAKWQQFAAAASNGSRKVKRKSEPGAGPNDRNESESDDARSQTASASDTPHGEVTGGLVRRSKTTTCSTMTALRAPSGRRDSSELRNPSPRPSKALLAPREATARRRHISFVSDGSLSAQETLEPSPSSSSSALPPVASSPEASGPKGFPGKGGETQSTKAALAVEVPSDCSTSVSPELRPQAAEPPGGTEQSELSSCKARDGTLDPSSIKPMPSPTSRPKLPISPHTAVMSSRNDPRWYAPNRQDAVVDEAATRSSCSALLAQEALLSGIHRRPPVAPAAPVAKLPQELQEPSDSNTGREVQGSSPHPRCGAPDLALAKDAPEVLRLSSLESINTASTLSPRITTPRLNGHSPMPFPEASARRHSSEERSPHDPSAKLDFPSHT